MLQLAKIRITEERSLHSTGENFEKETKTKKINKKVAFVRGQVEEIEKNDCLNWDIALRDILVKKIKKSTTKG